MQSVGYIALAGVPLAVNHFTVSASGGSRIRSMRRSRLDIECFMARLPGTARLRCECEHCNLGGMSQLVTGGGVGEH